MQLATVETMNENSIITCMIVSDTHAHTTKLNLKLTTYQIHKVQYILADDKVLPSVHPKVMSALHSRCQSHRGKTRFARLSPRASVSCRPPRSKYRSSKKQTKQSFSASMHSFIMLTVK